MSTAVYSGLHCVVAYLEAGLNALTEQTPSKKNDARNRQVGHLGLGLLRTCGIRDITSYPYLVHTPWYERAQRKVLYPWAIDKTLTDRQLLLLCCVNVSLTWYWYNLYRKPCRIQSSTLQNGSWLIVVPSIQYDGMVLRCLCYH